ncbi:MAG: hypothetical protein ACI9I0_000320 [Rhodoferax sp.]|jgi:hypothetical protein
MVIYTHDRLNSEAAAIQRAQAMGRYGLGNGGYHFLAGSVAC